MTAPALAARNGAPMPGVDPHGPPLVTALEQQAGLRLQPIRAPIEVVVIVRMERPAED